MRLSSIRALASRLCAVLPAILLCTTILGAQEKSSTFDELATQASAARERRDAQSAIRYYGQAVRLKPQWEEGWWYLGSLLYDADRYADAVPPFHRVTELDPDAGNAWAFLGLCEFELGRKKEALEHLRRAEALGLGDDAQLRKVALYHIILLLNSAGEFDKANNALVTEFSSGNVPDQIRFAMGMAMLRIPLLPSELDPSKDAVVRAAGETAALLAGHNLDAALASFPNMLKSYPETPYLHYAWGNALLTAQQIEPARSEFREETRIAPHNPLAWIALSRLELLQHRPNDALMAAKHAQEIAPDDPAVFDALAQAYQAVGQTEASKIARARHALLAGNPLSVESSQILRYSVSSQRTGVSSSEASSTTTQASFEKAVRDGDASQQSGHLEEATEFYREALRLQPEWNDAHRRLGTIAYMQERYPEAIAELQIAVKADPKQADAWTLLGLSEFRTKNYKNAKLHLERASDLGFGGNGAAVKVAAYHLALVLILEGRFDRATDVLIPHAGPGALESQIEFAMGLALLRISALPEDVTEQSTLIAEAGVTAAQLAQRHYDQAFSMLDAILLKYPNTPFLHYAYGASLANISEFDRAQLQLSEEIRINPASALPYIRLASVLLAMQQPAAAAEFAQRAVQLAPHSPESHYVLGRVMLEQDESTRAIQELELALQLAPGSPAIHFNLARAFTKAHREADAKRERAEFDRLNRIMTEQTSSKPSEEELSQRTGGVPDSTPTP